MIKKIASTFIMSYIVIVLSIWKPLTLSGNIVKNKFDWSSLDRKAKLEKLSRIFNVQIVSAFTTSDILIKQSNVCWHAATDDDLGVFKALICETEFESIFHFLRREEIIYLNQFFKMFLFFSSFCFVFTVWK